MIPKRNLSRAIKKSLKQPRYALEAFNKRLKSSITYKLYGGKSAYPETISLFLTYRCNLKCKMCGQWGVSGSSRAYTPEKLKQQLSLKDIGKLLDDVMDFSPNITLFGGEPLLYKNWPDVVHMIKKRKMRCNIITNGVLLEPNTEAIVSAGVDEIIFSLDGPQAVHDAIRGTAGTYEKALAGFKKISGLKKDMKSKFPVVNLSSAIFETNYEHLHEIITSAEKMGASSITFHHLIFAGEKTYARHKSIFQNHFSCSSEDWTGFVRENLPDINPEKLINMLDMVKTVKTRVDVSVYPNLTPDEIKRYYTLFDFLPDSYKNRCMSPWMTAYIFPEGSVRPCQSLNYSIGNIKENGFKQIWNGKEATGFRKILKKEKYFPVCPRCTEFYRY